MAGVPPGIEVKLELWRNKDEVMLDSKSANPDAKIVIVEAHLHVPIGTLDMSLFNGN